MSEFQTHQPPVFEAQMPQPPVEAHTLPVDTQPDRVSRPMRFARAAAAGLLLTGVALGTMGNTAEDTKNKIPGANCPSDARSDEEEFQSCLGNR